MPEAKCWALEWNSNQSCYTTGHVHCTFHSLGIFIVPGEEIADFDKSSGQANESEGCLARVTRRAQLCLRVKMDVFLWTPLAADAFFLPSCLLARVTQTRGDLISVYLLSQCTFTCNGNTDRTGERGWACTCRRTALNGCIIEYASTLPNVFRLMVYGQLAITGLYCILRGLTLAERAAKYMVYKSIRRLVWCDYTG